VTATADRIERTAGKSPRISGLARDGAAAGAASALVFTIVHDLTISNIWPMLAPMIVAGVLCGSCITWTYDRLFERQSVGTWIGYNAVFLAMIAALAAASVTLFEPVTSMAAISAQGGPVDELIVKALPLTGVFTFAATGLLGAAFARRRSDYLRLLLAVALLVLFLGLNVSVLGLVSFSGGSILPVVAFFGLIVLLDAVFAAVFIALPSARSLRGHR